MNKITQTLDALLIVFGLLAASCGVLRGASFSKADPTLVQTQGTGGQIFEKATLMGFQKEVEGALSEQRSHTTDYFKTAEHDFEKRRYADAADNYQKSSGVIPTMSAYLNLGLSLWYVSNFAQAQEAFSSGLRIAIKKQDRKFEAAFRGNIGNVYLNQGKLEEALKSYRDALAIHEEIGNPLEQANVLNNIGLIYYQRGKLEEALKSHRDALTTFNEIGNPLGQANARTNIGIVYRKQGKYEEALRPLNEARVIFSRIGVTGKLQFVERMISQLESATK